MGFLGLGLNSRDICNLAARSCFKDVRTWSEAMGHMTIQHPQPPFCC